MSKSLYLSSILENLVQAAQYSAGYPQRETLAHGLEIALVVIKDKMFLQLMRPKHPGPSALELKTVLDNLPFTPVLDYSKPFENEGRFYIRCAWAWPIVAAPEPQGAEQAKLI